jgi:hypothetical protein
MNRISPDYKKGQGELVTTSQRILEKMENNETFLPPPPTLAQLKKTIPELETALVNALGRDKEMIAIKNNKKAIVVNLLQELADYVTTICKGDLSLLLSSGFDVTNESPGNLLVAIEILEVKLGPPGEATTKVRKATGARAFIHQYTTEPPSIHTNWIWEASGLSSHTFKGLTSEKKHWFRVIAIGSGTQKAYSPIVSMVIQ